MSVGIRFAATLDDHNLGPTDDLVCTMSIRNPWEGFWLHEYNPNAKSGIGFARFESTSDGALAFDDFDAAKAFWGQQSTEYPTFKTRDGDEIENRPLTQVSIVIDTIPDVPADMHACDDPTVCVYCRTRVPVD